MGSGLLVNAYLAIIARTVSAAEYAYFGAFWSLALVAGFGMFLPIEQETARLMQVPDRPRGLLRAALLTALSLAGRAGGAGRRRGAVAGPRLRRTPRRASSRSRCSA